MFSTEAANERETRQCSGQIRFSSEDKCCLLKRAYIKGRNTGADSDRDGVSWINSTDLIITPITATSFQLVRPGQPEQKARQGSGQFRLALSLSRCLLFFRAPVRALSEKGTATGCLAIFIGSRRAVQLH